MATHSRILAWRIPWTGEPGGLQSMGSQRVRHDWSDLARNHRALVGNRKLVSWMEIDYYIESPGRLEESAENGWGQKKATQWDNSQNKALHLLYRSSAAAHTDNAGVDSGSTSQGLDMAALATKTLFSSCPFLFSILQIQCWCIWLVKPTSSPLTQGAKRMGNSFWFFWFVE